MKNSPRFDEQFLIENYFSFTFKCKFVKELLNCDTANRIGKKDSHFSLENDLFPYLLI